MKRQSLRKFLLVLMLLLFPAIYYYFSPYLIIAGLVEGIIAGCFVIFIIQGLAALVFGRAFCGWLCPAGAIQECAQQINSRKTKGGKLDLIKWIIWVIWLAPIVFFIYKNYPDLKVDFFYQTKDSMYLSMSRPEDVIIYTIIVLAIYLLSVLFGKRAFCHYLCWMAPFMIIGEKVRKKIKIPSLYLEANSNKCVNCKICNKVCQMSLDVNKMVISKKMHSSECIMCGVCIDNCNKKVIRYKWKK